MENITVKAEFLFELASKQQWINRVPKILPRKKRHGEHLIWVDKNGFTFESGKDFQAAEDHNSYPCKVYRLCIVSDFEETQIKNT